MRSDSSSGAAAFESGPALTRTLTFSLAVATGIAVANIYYNQPMLGILEKELGNRTSLIPTATQLGYALGLFLLVPLGDLVERRRLIVIQFLTIAAAMATAALSTSATMLIAASFAAGVLSTVAQQIVPLTAHLASPEKRGSAVGTVMSGLLCGILLSRVLSGFVSTELGWRDMFWLAVPLSLAIAGWLALRLPRSAPENNLSYIGLMTSLSGLWRTLPALRLAAVTQAMLFATFTAFWTILALRLQQPPFNLGANVAGLFGLLGVAGVLAAPFSGRIADRYGPGPVVAIGAVLCLVSWLVFGLWNSVAGMVVGVIILDLGMQAAMISNQHIIFALRPEARSRINTIFMGAMFLGGSAGSAAAAWAWSIEGWKAVSMLGIAIAFAASILRLTVLLRKN